MKTEISFDKEKFLNSCCCGCTKSLQTLLDGIKKYKESDPEISQYLEYYRNYLWERQVLEEKYRSMRVEFGDKNLNKKTADALRAVANKIEQSGHHFMIFCDLPEVPIFSGDDQLFCHIEVSVAAYPLGG